MAQLQIEVSDRLQYPTPPPTLQSESCWMPATSAAGMNTARDGTDRTETGEKIKRPMNAFMVWAQIRRAEITQKCEKVHNSLVSKALGAEWKTMSTEQKEPFVKKARELRDELFREHPNYVYRPRKRKHRTTDATSNAFAARTSTAPPPAKLPSQIPAPVMSNTKVDAVPTNIGSIPQIQSTLPNMLLYPSLNSLNSVSLPLANAFMNPLLLNQLLYNQLMASQLLQK